MKTNIEQLVLEGGRKTLKDLKKGTLIRFSLPEEPEHNVYQGLVTDKRKENVVIHSRGENGDVLRFVALFKGNNYPLLVARVDVFYHNHKNYRTYNSELTERGL